MKQDELAHAIQENRDKFPDRIPEHIRNVLDQTYARLADIDLKSIRRNQRKRRRFLRTSLAIAVLLIAGGVVIGSGFVSPVMANSLKQIPWINSIYERFGDAGLAAASRNGMVKEGAYSQTKAGRTVTISEFMYDGARLSVAVELQAEGKLPSYERGIFSVDARVDGEEGPYTFQIGDEKRIDDRKALRIISMGHSGYDGRTQQAYEFPDNFELTLTIAIAPREGVDDGLYEFTVPIMKNAPGAIVISSSEQKKYEDVTLSIEKLEITPATIHLVTLLGISANSNVEPPVRFKGRRILSYSLFDENGNEFESVSGSGAVKVGDQDLFKGKQSYEGSSTLPKTITIKPYAGLIKGTDGKPEKDYIKELEFTLELPKS